MCYYDGGDDQRDVTFTYRCKDAYGIPQVTQAEHITKYSIDLSGPAGCAVVAGLSYGSLTLILGGVAIVVYLAGGIFYNHRYREVPLGVGAIPQWAYWKQLPGLVRDGCKFSYAEASYLYGRWSGRNRRRRALAVEAGAEGGGRRRRGLRRLLRHRRRGGLRRGSRRPPRSRRRRSPPRRRAPASAKKWAPTTTQTRKR